MTVLPTKRNRRKKKMGLGVISKNSTQRVKIALCALLAFALLTAVVPTAFAAQPEAETAASAGKTGKESGLPDVVTIDIGIRPAAYNDLVSDPSNTPHKITFQLDGGSYSEGELSNRGSSSLDTAFAMPAKRVPLELEVDELSPAYDIVHNTTIKFTAPFTPARLFSEYFAFELFESAGVPTPEHRFVFIRMNGLDLGLYLAIEDANREFLAKHYDNAYGSLYKGSNKTFETGSKREAFGFSEWFGLIFSKLDAGDRNITAFIKEMTNRGEYEKYINFDEWMPFFACTSAYGGEASIFNEQNNFLLYDNDGRFDLLPWDLSEAFFAIPTKDGIDKYYLYNYRNDIPSSGDIPCPLFELIMQDEAHKEQYHKYIKEICDDFLSPEIMHKAFLNILDKTAPYLERDVSMINNNKNTAAALISESDDSLSGFLYHTDRIYENLLDQLDGKTDRFYSSSFMSSYGDSLSSQVLLESAMDDSDLLDKELPEKIRGAYRSWKAAYRRDTGYDNDLSAGIAVFCAGCAAVAMSFLIHRRKGTLRKSKSYEDDRKERRRA